VETPRLDHVVIKVSDWERSNAFYRDVVGGRADRAPSRAGRIPASERPDQCARARVKSRGIAGQAGAAREQRPVPARL